MKSAECKVQNGSEVQSAKCKVQSDAPLNSVLISPILSLYTFRFAFCTLVMRSLFCTLHFALCAFFLAGCCVSPPAPYTGPTDPMAKVVADINANNSKIPTLYAHHYYEADIVDEKHNNHHVSGDGVLLYMAPMSMRLRGNAVIGNVVDIGSNPETFWLKLSPEAGDTMWWGSYANFGRINLGNTEIPIRPDMVLDVLGFKTIDKDLTGMPAPTMRFDPYADAYVFVWNDRLADRWAALREIWYDRATKLPKLVLIYDASGRVLLRGEYNSLKTVVDGRPVMDMANYRQVEVPGLAKAQWPWIPSNYHLFFPENGSHLTFSLEQAVLSEKTGAGVIPQPASFKMPDPANVDVGHVIEIK